MRLDYSEESEHWVDVVKRIAGNRDRQAFSDFFDHFAGKIKTFSLAKQPGAELLADELVQEVMLKVWQKAHTYNPKLSSVSTWLYTMARNCRIDQLRRSRKHDQLFADDLWMEEEATEPDPFFAIAMHRTDMRIQQNLNQLPAEQLQVLKKVYLQGCTQQEAADQLQLPLGTVKSRIRLALKKLESTMR